MTTIKEKFAEALYIEKRKLYDYDELKVPFNEVSYSMRLHFECEAEMVIRVIKGVLHAIRTERKSGSGQR